MRELSKEIKIGEDIYVLRKMDPFDGAFLIKFVTSKLIPLLTEAKTVFSILDEKPAARKGRAKAKDGEMSETEMLEGALKLLPTLLDNIDRDTMKEVMVCCLNHVDKRLPAGDQQVMRGENFGIADAEYDTGLCLVLTLQSAMYNCGSFFGENGLDLSSITKRLTSRPNQ